MATTGTPAIIENASRFPRDVARAIQARPTMLRDETQDVVAVVAGTLAMSGYKSELLNACDEVGLDTARQAIIRAACRHHSDFH